MVWGQASLNTRLGRDCSAQGLAQGLRVPGHAKCCEVQRGVCTSVQHCLFPWDWHQEGAEELLSHKAQCCFENAELCIIVTEPKRCPYDLEVGPAMGDPGHVF